MVLRNFHFCDVGKSARLWTWLKINRLYTEMVMSKLKVGSKKECIVTAHNLQYIKVSNSICDFFLFLLKFGF